MLLILAWRNIWRNRRRSVIVMTAIAIGITALLLTDAIYNGLLDQMLDNQIRSHIAHLEIHARGFNDNKMIQNSMTAYGDVEKALRANPNIFSFSKRVITFGIISSASNAAGVSIVGVDPKEESNVTLIKESVVAGRYLDTNRNQIVIAGRLAEKLSVGLDDKIVLMASAVDGHIASDVFRIVGLFETSASDFDRTFAFVPIHHAQQMLGLGGSVSEFAVITKNPDLVSQTQSDLAALIGTSYEVLSYKDLIPNIIMVVDVGRQAMVVYYLIIGIAILFGITNAMLMSVFERTRELGILMATGMKNARIVAMILTEALFLSVAGTVVGICIGLAVYIPLASSGIDLGSVGEGLTMVGASPIIHPTLTPRGMVNAITIIPIISMIASLYPAFRATRLVPVRAIQYV